MKRIHFWSVAIPAIAAALVSSLALAQPAPGSIQPPMLAAIPYPLTASSPQVLAGVGRDELTLAAGKGTDLYANTSGTESSDNTPRVLFQPEGDFIFSARVSGRFGAAFDGGALIVYVDKSHWAKLLLEQGKDGKAVISTTVTQSAGDDALHQQVEGSSVHLKIARKGGMYVFYTSADGVQWRVTRAFGLPGSGKAMVGFSSQSPKGPSFSARFSDVRYRGAGFKDYWQGE